MRMDRAPGPIVRHYETDRSLIVKQRLALNAAGEQDFVVPKGWVQLTQREYHPITVTRLG